MIPSQHENFNQIEFRRSYVSLNFIFRVSQKLGTLLFRHLRPSQTRSFHNLPFIVMKFHKRMLLKLVLSQVKRNRIISEKISPLKNKKNTQILHTFLIIKNSMLPSIINNSFLLKFIHLPVILSIYSIIQPALMFFFHQFVNELH